MTTDLMHLSQIGVAGFLETYNLILWVALNNLNLGIDEAFFVFNNYRDQFVKTNNVVSSLAVISHASST